MSSAERHTSVLPANPPPFQNSGISSLAASGRDRGFGALLDTFLGANISAGPFVAGIQLEGSLAELSFNSDGERHLTYFDARGPTGQTAFSDFRPHVHARWMISVLARGGLLLDPNTLAYALGGWTGAMFGYANLTDNLFFQPDERYWANGITVGGGLERKLGAQWSIRGEYRYTYFPEVNVSNNFSWSSNFPSTQTNTIQTQFENDVHVLRLGVSYLFGSGRAN